MDNKITCCICNDNEHDPKFPMCYYCLMNAKDSEENTEKLRQAGWVKCKVCKAKHHKIEWDKCYFCAEKEKHGKTEDIPF